MSAKYQCLIFETFKTHTHTLFNHDSSSSFDPHHLNNNNNYNLRLLHQRKAIFRKPFVGLIFLKVHLQLIHITIDPINLYYKSFMYMSSIERNKNIKEEVNKRICVIIIITNIILTIYVPRNV